MKRLALLVVSLVLLAACQPAVPTAAPTPTPPTDVTAVPLEVNVSGLNPANFRFTYNDPVAGEFKTVSGPTSYSKIRNLDEGFLLNLNVEGIDVFVAFAIPENLAPGTYALNNYDYSFSDDNRQVANVGATIAIANYFELKEGTFTVTGVAPLTGAFQFSGIAEINETDTVTVTVEGLLNEIPLVGTNPLPGQ
ncbi:MAG: hypothetical protein K8L97_31785 [Anaerolineae bacterium]|nr:hypothetical protein [Anaerolineae bacterium]